jgi:hypothetical protein
MRHGYSGKRWSSQGAVRLRRSRQERWRAHIYFFSGEDLPVFVLAAFAKNEKADLSVSERNALSRMVRDMIENYRRQK